MERVMMTASALALMTSAAVAGGVDRTGQSVSVLFEKGRYAELSFGAVSPDVSGVSTAFSPLANRNSGDMAGNYTSFAFAYRQDFAGGFSGAVIVDQPFGADVNYPAGTLYFAQRSTAKLSSTAVTGLVKYTSPSNVSVYGGLRYQTFQAEASVPFVANYTATSKTDGAFGYVLGAAFEIPDKFVRVALTYNSSIGHDLDTTEFGALKSTTHVDTPQSVNLDFQTGLPPDLLLMGSVRWVEWSKFKIDPLNYPPATPIVSYADDTISYSLGLGKKFSDSFFGFAMLGYEGQIGGFSSNLGPTDGYKSLTLGGVYTKGNMKVKGGVTYRQIGDAQTTLNGTLPASNFTGNTAIGAGVTVGWTF